jgi:hypothetical protein
VLCCTLREDLHKRRPPCGIGLLSRLANIEGASRLQVKRVEKSSPRRLTLKAHSLEEWMLQYEYSYIPGLGPRTQLDVKRHREHMRALAALGQSSLSFP